MNSDGIHPAKQPGAAIEKRTQNTSHTTNRNPSNAIQQRHTTVPAKIEIYIKTSINRARQYPAHIVTPTPTVQYSTPNGYDLASRGKDSPAPRLSVT